MKATENKSSTTATLQAKHEQTPFFKKEGQDGFFSTSTEKTAPFFKPTSPLGGKGAIQPKLKIGQPNDKYEKEADSVADTVVQKLSSPPSLLKGESAHTNTSPLGGRGAVQRKCATCEQEEKLQKKEDKEEISLKEESIQRKPIFESNDDNTSPLGERGATIQRKCADCGATLEDEKAEISPSGGGEGGRTPSKEEPLMMKSEGGETVGTSALQSQLNASKGKGASLPENTRTDMESTIGADFSGVSIHTDSNAVQMNKDLGAKAFTHGSDVYFNQGQYDTSSSGGQHLLAHELTHTVQQGGAAATPTVQKEEEETASPIPAGSPAAALDITHRFSPNAAWKAYLEENPANTDVRVKIGNDYEGIIRVNQTQPPTEGSTGKYELARNERLHYLKVNGLSFLNPLRNAGVTPILVLRGFGEDQLTKAFLSVKMGEEPVGDVLGLIQGFNAQMEAMGFLGLDRLQVPAEGVQNRFEQGRLVFQVSQLATVVDGFIEAGGGIGIVGNSLTFDLVSDINIEGIAQGEFTIGRGEDGQLHGRAEIAAQLANVEALLLVEYQNGSVTIQGTGTINSEKFTGAITLLVTDRERSREMMHAALGVQALEGAAGAVGQTPAAPKTPQNQVLAGWGEVTATITPWLQGSAKVGIDHEGHVTMIGELSVPDEIELMEQRGKKIQLVDFEIRAGYGVPLVGQVFIFGGLGLFINAGFGPLVLRDIRLAGTYSTDPSILQEFTITGALGINAFAVLGLEAEAGVGVTLLGHDVKAGINATAAAGLRAYAEARPTFEYTESMGEAGGKVGEAHLKGHFEAAAQLFLMLSGAFFVELDSPWWSPAPDDRWDYPLGSVEYPIGDSMGIGADMDWLVGSDQVPELDFTPVEFNAEKFTADVMADPPPGRGNGGDAEEQGTWTDGPGGGGLEANPDVQEGGEGLPQSRQQEENLRNLPDEQKYMRGLSEISDIAESRERPTIAVVRTKINRVKQRYGLDHASIRDENDNNVTIFVRHALQNNSNNLVEVPVMSEAERTRMLSTAMRDLDTRLNAQANEEGKVAESQAQSTANAWAEAHPVVESVSVIDGGDSWDFMVDIGDREQRVPGKGKAESVNTDEIENRQIGDDEVGETVSFGDSHTLWVNVSGGDVTVVSASVRMPVVSRINQWRILANDTRDENKKSQLISLLSQASTKLSETEGHALRAEIAKSAAIPDIDVFNEADNATENAENTLSVILENIYNLLEIISEVELDPIPVGFGPIPDKYDRAEYFSQLKAQEEGINRINVHDWLNNRSNYSQHGRSHSGNVAQAEYRAAILSVLRDLKMEEDENILFSDAEAWARNYLDSQAALHDPDQVAGGDPKGIAQGRYDSMAGLGNKRINSSIGSRWRTRAPRLENAVRLQINSKNLDQNQQEQTMMKCVLYI